LKGKDWFALVLILLGLLLLGDNLGFFRFSYIWRLWPLVLVIIGVSMFMKKDQEKKKSTVEVSFTTTGKKVEPEESVKEKEEEDDEEDEI